MTFARFAKRALEEGCIPSRSTMTEEPIGIRGFGKCDETTTREVEDLLDAVSANSTLNNARNSSNAQVRWR